MNSTSGGNVNAGQSLHEPHANWSLAERPLRQIANCDVLVILDCCAAGNVFGPWTHSERTYEILAAAGRNCPTPHPGPTSYTTILIMALRALMTTGRAITTWELQQAISLIHRWDTVTSLHSVMMGRNGRHISLVPLQSRRERGEGTLSDEAPSP